MLMIYAKSFMTASRLNTPELRDAPARGQRRKKRWLPAGHWWLRHGRTADLDNL